MNVPYCHICGREADCRCMVPVTAIEYERRKREAREWSAGKQHRNEDGPLRAYLPLRVPREYRIVTDDPCE